MKNFKKRMLSASLCMTFSFSAVPALSVNASETPVSITHSEKGIYNSDSKAYKTFLSADKEFEEPQMLEPYFERKPFLLLDDITDDTDIIEGSGFTFYCIDTDDHKANTLVINGNSTGSYSWNDLDSRPWHSFVSRTEHLVICDSIKEIGNNAFNGMSKLKDVTFPDELKRIGYYAFCNCTSLESIALSAECIDQLAFQSCIRLSDISLKSGVKTIYSAAFLHCPIKQINIPDTVENLWRPFNMCYHLEKITVDSNNKVYSSEDGLLYNKDKSELVFCPINYNWGSDIENSAVFGSVPPVYHQTKLTLMDTVKKIGNDAFENNGSIIELDNIHEYCTFGTGVFTGSEYIKKHCYNDSRYTVEGNDGNKYFLINGVLFNYLSYDDKCLFDTTSIPEDHEIKRLSYCGNGDIKELSFRYAIDVDSNCLDNTEWYKSQGIGKVSINVKGEKLLYKYLFDASDVIDGDISRLSVDLSDQIGITDKAFAGNDKKVFDINIKNDIRFISETAFKSCNINTITAFDGEDKVAVDAGYLDLRDKTEDIQITNADGIQDKARIISEKHKDDFAYKLAIAVINNTNYLDKLADIYCRSMIKENGINDKGSNNAKIDAVSKWIKSNCRYNSFIIENKYGDITANEHNYSTHFGLTHSIGALMFNGSGVCTSYSYLFKKFMDLLSVDCIAIIGEQHMWNAVKTDEGWCYYEPETQRLFGQSQMTDEYYSGYRETDEQYLFNISNLKTDSGENISVLREISEKTTPEPQEPTEPDEPDILSVISAEDGRITWIAVDNAKYYKASYVVGDKVTTSKAITNTAYTFLSAPKSNDYQVYVTAHCKNGKTIESKKYTVKNLGTVSKPIVNNGTVTWEAVNNAKYYKVSYIVDGKTTTSKAITDTSYAFLSAPKNKDYQVYVTAYDGNAKSAASSTVTVKTLGTIGTPTVNDGIITWKPVNNAKYYKVSYIYNDKTTTSKAVTDTSYTFLSAPRYNDYQVYVTAYGENGKTVVSQKVNVKNLGLIEKPSVNNSVISWKPVNNAKYYKVSYTVGDNTTTSKAIKETSYTFLSAPKNKTYQVYVTAYGEKGRSIESKKVTVKP